jgi:hypothetical protein
VRLQIVISEIFLKCTSCTLDKKKKKLREVLKCDARAYHDITIPIMSCKCFVDSKVLESSGGEHGHGDIFRLAAAQPRSIPKFPISTCPISIVVVVIKAIGK